ncbi:fructose 1,6-bisphosphatase [Loktanella sp. 5RATIMAR09]|uniref:class 1 fructose-bisphosphatase n=1 Tax=Loktanella sp. 5RATIMAR09 TaxID=1225655 RepID=UPI0006EBD791|nr:class 1 fructose-bisphosphatase [Loktanella sp. 5RATIMAR09]KQI70764.1 fructose 1,6-bisphosphatase [Loktanella sp. 5RATIMAR09]
MTEKTLRRHLTESALDPNLIFLLEDIASACRVVANKIRNGAFDGNLGSADAKNVQGETQKTLDILANDEFERICANSPRLAALVSEEVEEVTWLKEPQAGDYLLYFDPLDGSSNLDVNLSVGSIFAIMQVQSDADRNVLLSGRKQVCAGYALYGPSTTFVLTTGSEVSGFTNERGTGDFRLTHPDMTVPHETSEFAINTSRYRYWDQPVRRYVDECVAGEEGIRERAFNMRWTASMVADIHRILTRGGVFLYPADSENRAAGGKLRLMYEANPMAMIIENAGGVATTGNEPILDLQPTGPHQRVPVIMGSKSEVDRLVRYHKAESQ